MRLINKLAKGLRRQEGQLLIEVLIALVILGIVVVAFLSGLSTASRAIIIADERTTAESLTRTQLECVKNQPYNRTAPEATYPKIDGSLDGYLVKGLKKDGYVWDEAEGSTKIVVNDDTVDPDSIIGVAWDSDSGKTSDSETGIQIVTVIIYHEGKVDADKKLIPVLITTDYKVDR